MRSINYNPDISAKTNKGFGVFSVPFFCKTSAFCVKNHSLTYQSNAFSKFYKDKILSRFSNTNFAELGTIRECIIKCVS